MPISKLTLLEVPPPGVGLITVTGTVPGVVMAEAGMEAVNFVVLTNWVAMAWPLNLMTEVVMNRLPWTVKVKAGSPAEIEMGTSPEITGTGLLSCRIVRRLSESSVTTA